jgi:hypothetical protein
MRIKFLKDPCGMYRLSYEVGEVVNLPDPQAKDLIAAGYAEKTTQPVGHFPPEGRTYIISDKETSESKVKTEKR